MPARSVGPGASDGRRPLAICFGLPKCGARAERSVAGGIRAKTTEACWADRVAGHRGRLRQHESGPARPCRGGSRHADAGRGRRPSRGDPGGADGRGGRPGADGGGPSRTCGAAGLHLHRLARQPRDSQGHPTDPGAGLPGPPGDLVGRSDGQHHPADGRHDADRRRHDGWRHQRRAEDPVSGQAANPRARCRAGGAYGSGHPGGRAHLDRRPGAEGLLRLLPGQRVDRHDAAERAAAAPDPRRGGGALQDRRGDPTGRSAGRGGAVRPRQRADHARAAVRHGAGPPQHADEPSRSTARCPPRGPSSCRGSTGSCLRRCSRR